MLSKSQSAGAQHSPGSFSTATFLVTWQAINQNKNYEKVTNKHHVCVFLYFVFFFMPSSFGGCKQSTSRCDVCHTLMRCTPDDKDNKYKIIIIIIIIIIQPHLYAFFIHFMHHNYKNGRFLIDHL